MECKECIKMREKIHSRCSHCQYYKTHIDPNKWICYKSTDEFLCELFKLKYVEFDEDDIKE